MVPTYLETIDSVNFYVKGDAENEAESVVEIQEKETLRGNMPVPNGTYDAHLGPTMHEWGCASCFNGKQKCLGHEGHISLNYPIQCGTYVDEIRKWLRIICFKCGHLLIDKTRQVEIYPRIERFQKYVTLTRTAGKNVNCVRCGALHPNIIKGKETNLVILQEWWAGGKVEGEPQRLYNHQIVPIFDRITDETLEVLGKHPSAHPRKFIVSSLKVPPNNIRPEIKRTGAGRSSSNDITVLLRAIVEINRGLPMIPPDVISDDLADKYTNLDMAAFEMIKGTPETSSKSRVVSNINRTLVSLALRGPRKQGRFRKNLLSARTWGVGRSVITEDPMMPIDHVGMPEEMAKELQIPEVVSPANRARVMVYFNNKRDAYPGCTSIIKKGTQKLYWINNLRHDFVLEDGDTVMRDLVDGDYIVFNRMPSLTEQYLSCFKIKVLPNTKSLRINISICVMYAADFDGDTAYAFVPASDIAINEMSHISSVGSHFISQQSGKPFLGLLWDALAGCVEMTRTNQRVTRYNAMELFKHYPPFTLDAPSATCRELISKLLPPINYQNTAFFYNEAYAPHLRYKPDDIEVVIKRGQLEKGVLDHNSMGQEKNKSIWHMIYAEFGPERALQSMFDVQMLQLEFMKVRGLTVGIDDIMIPPEAVERVREKISSRIAEANRVTNKLKAGEIVPPINMTVHDAYEQQQIAALAFTDEFIEPILGSIDPENNGLYKMIAYCKKGSMATFQSINAGIGSTLIHGRRAKMNFGYARTLPYFPRFDTDPISRGFVPDSYISGISPTSFVFGAQEARHQMANKQLKTSVPGAQNREFVKNLESLITNNLRQATKHRRIVQFLYGDDGFNLARLEEVTIATPTLSDAEFETLKYPDPACADEWAALCGDREWLRATFMKLEATHPSASISKYLSPIPLRRIVANVVHDLRGREQAPTFRPEYIVDKVRAFCQRLPYAYLNSSVKIPAPHRYHAAVRHLLAYVRASLCCAVLKTSGVTDGMLSIILDKAWVSMKRALIEYGVSIGALAALSSSQPMTQYIISSHHHTSGTGGGNISETDKITRSKEIMLAKLTDAMQNPSMKLYVRPEHERDALKVTEIANTIEMMTLRRFVLKVQIFFEEYGNPIHPTWAHEKALIKDFEAHNVTQVPQDITRWVIRLELDRRAMILKNMDLDTIIIGISAKHPELYLVYNTENAAQIVVRCYVRGIMFGKKKEPPGLHDLKDVLADLLATVIRGVNGVIIAQPKREKASSVAPDGSIQKRDIWVIHTEGSNLEAILADENFDQDKCQTDSLWEIYDLFGIEAAREKLRIELEKLVPGISPYHYKLFADEMCSTGLITGISRPGLAAREPQNILLRTAYGNVNQTLKEAAVNSVHNEVYGLSAPLLLGRAPYVGSTYNRIAIDREFVSRNAKTVSSIIDDL
jgi:DNA-directed RNA polymerase II subunit RPB1